MDEFHRFLPHHFRCASHTLNLMATTDFLNCLRASKKVHVRGSNQQCNTLWKLMGSPKQKEEFVKIFGTCLPRLTVIRWNSLYNAICKIVELEKKILAKTEKEKEKAEKSKPILRDVDYYNS